MSERFAFPPLAAELRKLRSDVRLAATKLGGDEGIGDVVALVADELVNNAIEHGSSYRQHNTCLELEIDRAADRWRLTFLDPEMPAQAVAELAVAFGEVARGMPALENERGRGLFLLSVYLEQIAIGEAPGGGLRLQGWVAKT